MIQQAKFTYSPLRKTFEKQIKTIKNQGEKQIKAIQNQGQVKTIRKYTYDDEDIPMILKQKEIFNKLADERLDEITKLDEKVNLDDLIYRYKDATPDEKFNKFDNVLNLIDKPESGEKHLAEAKNDQIKFNSNLAEIKKGKNKSKVQKNATYTIEMLYKARSEAITFFENYSLMVSEPKLKVKMKQTIKQLKEQDLKY